MKKLLGIVVLGLLLSGNAYALELTKINFPEADIKLYEGPKSSQYLYI